jgi:D-threonate/D-erythronate kinase
MIPGLSHSSGLLLVIADDLTGANEIAMSLCAGGRRPLVLSDLPAGRRIAALRRGYGALVLNLDTRELPREAAYEKVHSALDGKSPWKDRLIYKKVDSTVRGNLVEEIEALLHAGAADLVLFAPASPQSRRITAGGYHLIDGVPVGRTSYGGREKTSHLPGLFGKSRYGVELLTLEIVESGLQPTVDFIEAAWDRGVRIVVADACTDDDLFHLGKACMHVRHSVLPAGAAALFEQICPPVSPGGFPCLFVCGSLDPVSRKQTAALEREGVTRVEVDPGRLRKKKTTEEARVVRICLAALKGRNDLLLSTPAVRVPHGEAVSAGLGRLVRMILDRQRVSGLVLTGGDVAVSVIRSLEAEGVEILQRLSPLVPAGRLKGGPFDRLPVVTKGGGVGEEEIFIRALHHFREGFEKISPVTKPLSRKDT